ncbi:MAG: amidohydrolase family protein [Actinobacteria bacterium]|nr:amidohydrolase family protein [Actinomycetota bacterium]
MSTLLLDCRPAGGPTVTVPASFALRVHDGGIRDLGDLEARPDETVLDLAGAYLVPGLVDAHVHLELGGMDPHESGDLNIAHGVTAVRDLGRAERPWDRTRAGAPLAVRASGGLTRQGAYGGFIGRELGPGDDVVRAVRHLVAAGAQVVKIVVSGRVDFERRTAASPHFSRAELRAMIHVAHEMGVPVAVHANGCQAIEWAVEAGADSIEHGILADEDTIAAIAGSRCVWVPTLTALHAQNSAHGWPMLPHILADHQMMVFRAREMGAQIATGTDAGATRVKHGSLLTECVLLREAGLSPSEVRDAATVVAARLLGLPDDYGRLQRGALTDLVWFRSDPFASSVVPAPGASTERPLGMLLVPRCQR